MNHLPLPRWKYTGETPGADTTERTLFATPEAFGSTKGACALAGIQRIQIFLPVSGASTIKFYYSQDGGATYTEDTTRSKVVGAATANTYDFFVGDVAGDDFKITHTNSAAAAQTTWGPRITGTTDRSVAT